MLTTTYGTGQLIMEAAEYGAEKIMLAIGGSATVDGGVGAAMALGWKFLDQYENPVELGGASLNNISHIIKPDNYNLPYVEVLCDVDNVLCGQYGAARIFGPQIGATPDMIKQLENGLINLADIVEKQLNKNIKTIPGTGAAGGLSAGAIAFMDAELVSGIDTIIEESGLQGEMKDADWIITGEGSFDSQSLMGKVIHGICKIAQKTNTKVAVIAGQVKVDETDYQEHGIIKAVSCRKKGMSLDYAIKNSRNLLKIASEEIAKILESPIPKIQQ
jgi:glycerate kinase